MRITREYVFEMIDMIGKAVAGVRNKKIVTAKDLDRLTPDWLKKMIDGLTRRMKKRDEDPWGVMAEAGWKDSETSEETDLSTIAAGAESFSESAVEKKFIRREWDQYGDSIGCRLWELDRQLRFKEVGVYDALKELGDLCRQFNRYISPGWGDRIIRIIDEHSR